MSDAVHFATWDDQADMTKASGFNGFPAPYNDGSDFPYAYQYLVPFTQIIKWYWRVKKWTVTSVDVTITAGLNTTAISVGDLPAMGPTRELDLIQQGTVLSTNIGSLEWDLFAGNVAPSIKQDGTDLFPSLAIAGRMVAGGPSDPDEIIVDFKSDPALFGATGHFNAAIDGITVPIYYKVSAGGTTSYSITSLVLDPVEFWPYAASDTSPIYNTSTGAQLQDPRN